MTVNILSDYATQLIPHPVQPSKVLLLLTVIPVSYHLPTYIIYIETVIINTVSCAAFHEDDTSNTFGRLTKGGKYKAYSDFRFEFTAKVKGINVSGYLLDVYSAAYDDCESQDEPL